MRKKWSSLSFAIQRVGGQFRRFSKKNLYEFAIALQIRKFQIPVDMAKIVLTVLQKFEKTLKKEMKDFDFEHLAKKGMPEMKVFIDNGEDILFSLGKDFLLKFNMSKFSKNKKSPIHLVILNELPKTYEGRLEINISKIVKNFSKKVLT